MGDGELRTITFYTRALRAAVPHVLSAVAVSGSPATADRTFKGAWNPRRFPLHPATLVRDGTDVRRISGTVPCDRACERPTVATAFLQRPRRKRAGRGDFRDSEILDRGYDRGCLNP